MLRSVCERGEDSFGFTAAVDVDVLSKNADYNAGDILQVQTIKGVNEHEATVGLGEEPFGLVSWEARRSPSRRNDESNWFLRFCSVAGSQWRSCINLRVWEGCGYRDETGLSRRRRL